MPMEVSQSQTSVPSRSMARMLYPPPGNTSMAERELGPVGEYKVKVGADTLPSLMIGLPPIVWSPGIAVSSLRPCLASEPGAARGQRGTVVVPTAGCHAVFWASEKALVNIKKKKSQVLCIPICRSAKNFPHVYALQIRRAELTRKVNAISSGLRSSSTPARAARSCSRDTLRRRNACRRERRRRGFRWEPCNYPWEKACGPAPIQARRSWC